MELDLVKKNWKRLDFTANNSIETDFSIIKKKESVLASNTTKRLFIFSIIEFVLWGVLGIILQFYFQKDIPDSFLQFKPLIYLEKVNYLVLAAFVAAFLWSYNSIKTISGVREMLSRILKTKQLVTYYVYYNIIVFAFTFLTSFIWELFNNEQLTELLKNKHGLIIPGLIVFGIALTFIFTVLVYRAYRFFYERFIINFNGLSVNLRELDKK
ncbi:MAG: hypothetical protein GYB37_11065 [Algicola sp.]|nr:hypothetical protein [Algicola sp.]